MKKLILTGLLTLLTAKGFAKGGSDIGSGTQPKKTIQCEVNTIKKTGNSSLVDITLTPLSLRFDKDGESQEDLKDLGISAFAYEDATLKGLYQLSLVTDDNTDSPNRASVSVLLKKDELISSLNDGDLAFSNLQIPDGKMARAYAVVVDTHLSGVPAVSATNKLTDIVNQFNSTAVESEKIYIHNTMLMQDFLIALENPNMKKIIQSHFSKNEVIAIGLNSVCLSDK